jgi:hypothetical protein
MLAGRSGVRIPIGTKSTVWLQGPPSLLFIGYRGSLFGGGVKLTIHLHLVPRLRMSGVVPLLPLYTYTYVTLVFTPPGLKVMVDGWILFPDGIPIQDGTLVTTSFMHY